MSRRMNDPADEMAGMVMGAIGLAVGGMVAGGVAIANKLINTPRLPKVIEPDTQFKLTSSPKRYVISLPYGIEWKPDKAWRFAENLITTVPHLILGIVAEHNRITWEVYDWRTGASSVTIKQIIHAYYPEANVDYLDYYYPEQEYPFRRYVMLFRQATDFVWPIKSISDLKDFDPLIALTQSMSHLEPGERIIYSLSVSIPADYAYKEGKKMVTVSRIMPLQFLSVNGTILALADLVAGRTRDDKYRETDQKIARTKLNSSLYQCHLTIQIDSPSRKRVEQLAAIDAKIWQFENQPYNSLVWVPVPWPDSILNIQDFKYDAKTSFIGNQISWNLGKNKLWKPSRLILSSQEIAALWHLPYEGFSSPEIGWSPGRRVVAPAAVIENKAGVKLGDNVYGSQRNTIRIPYSDRETHAYIVGKTGVGKSTLAHNIIHQDITNGKGVGVIDPHGKLVRDILRSSIPEDREDDVILVDFANTSYPPPLNPFSVPEGLNRSVAISQIMGVLKKIYADDWSRTRMESAIYSALVALLYEEQPTPRDISRLFLDEKYRLELLVNVRDPVALEYWYDEFGHLSPGVQKQTREPVLNRIRIFYRNRSVRNMVCHPQRLNFRQIIEDGKIFLASLSSDETRSERANLGAMLITNFQLAAMSNQVVEGGERQPFYLFIDEVQEFVTTTLPTVFSEARKFGLCLTVANQFLGQLRGDTLESILGNVGEAVIFSCGPNDARALAPFVRPEFTVDDLTSFDRFNAVVRMQLNKKTMPAFSVGTLPPPTVPNDAHEREMRIRQKSIERYTPWNREEVETWLENRYSRPDLSFQMDEITDYD